jgi:hypothetical protein
VSWLRSRVFSARLEKRSRRALPDVDVLQNTSADPARFRTAPFGVHENADLLVARARESEFLCERSHPTRGLCDGRRGVVEPSKRDDEAAVDARSLLRHP